MEAIALLQEWVQTIGSRAGLTDQNATILSGAVGVPESRLELEIELDSLAQLESFWGQIAPQAHKAWSQRAQHFLIDGSPQWEVYRNVSMPAVSEPGQMSLPAAEPAVTQTQAGLIMPDYKQQPQGLVIPENPRDQSDDMDPPQNEDVMLDWKGDPMVVNPGDRLPFNFR